MRWLATRYISDWAARFPGVRLCTSGIQQIQIRVSIGMCPAWNQSFEPRHDP
jgi:hypothetical protein